MLSLTQDEIRRAVSSAFSQAIFASVFFVAAMGVYVAGLEGVRYHDSVNDLYNTWFYWRLWLTIFLPTAAFLSLWIFVSQATSINNSSARPNIFLTVVLGVGAFLAYEIVMNIIAWVKCNDFSGPTPVEANCINRAYPAKDDPDISFALQFWGAVAFEFFIIICFYVGFNVRCLAGSKQVAGGYYTRNTESSYGPYEAQGF